MRTTLLKYCPVVMGICCILFFGSAIAENSNRADPPANEVQALQAMLRELRQLRIAIEGTNLVAYRAQITLDRMKLHQLAVDRIRQQLEEAQDQAAGLSVSRLQLVEHIKDLESKARTDEDERELKDSKISLDQQVNREAQLRERRIQLEADLQMEGLELDHLNNRLKDLELEMHTREQNNKLERSNAP